MWGYDTRDDDCVTLEKQPIAQQVEECSEIIDEIQGDGKERPSYTCLSMPKAVDRSIQRRVYVYLWHVSEVLRQPVVASGAQLLVLKIDGYF